MIHALLYLVFGVCAAAWLRFELKKDFSLFSHSGWLVGAAVFGLIGSLLSSAFSGIAGNFLLHSVGGGMASVCLFYYLARNVGLKLHWRLELVALFVFVCTLGVLNELGEYAIELTLHIIMSPDSHDTWRDLLANSIGSVTLWTLFRSLRIGRYKSKWF